MKKLLKMLLASIMVTSLIFTVACGNSSSQSASESSNTVTLGVWKGTDVEGAALQKVINKFEKSTGLTVKVKVYNDFVTQLQTDLIGGTAPDVFYVDSSVIPSLEAKQVVEPLDSYIAKDKTFDPNDFYKSIYNAFKGTDGKQYGIPKDYSILAMYYNKDLFKKAGVDPKTIPTNAKDLGSFLVKLKTKLPAKTTPYVFTADLSRQMFVAQASGEKIITKDGYSNLDNPKIVSAIQPLVDWYKQGLLRTSTDLGQSWSGDSFGTGKVAMMMEGNWAIAQLQQKFKDINFGTTEVPEVNGQKGTMAFTVSYSMNAASKNKQNAWKLISYLTGKQGMEMWAKGASVLPSRQSLTRSMNLSNDPILKPFVAGAKYATPFQEGPNLTTIQNEYKNMISSALKGNMTLKQAMIKATQSANDQIKKNQ